MSVTIAFTPQWFHGIDIAFEILIVFISLLIANYGYRIYRFTEEKRYKYFSIMFFLAGMAFIAKILTNFTIYYKVLQTIDYGIITITTTRLYLSDILFAFGFFFYRLFFLSAFFGIFLLYESKYSKRFIIFLAYLMLAATFASHYTFFIFHLNAVVLLLMIFSKTYENYANTGSRAAGIVSACFLVLSISQLVFIFSFINTIAYVFGELIQLVGFILLLYVYMVKGGRDEKG